MMEYLLDTISLRENEAVWSFASAEPWGRQVEIHWRSTFRAGRSLIEYAESVRHNRGSRSGCEASGARGA